MAKNYSPEIETIKSRYTGTLFEYSLMSGSEITDSVTLNSSTPQDAFNVFRGRGHSVPELRVHVTKVYLNQAD